MEEEILECLGNWALYHVIPTFSNSMFIVEILQFLGLPEKCADWPI